MAKKGKREASRRRGERWIEGKEFSGRGMDGGGMYVIRFRREG